MDYIGFKFDKSKKSNSKKVIFENNKLHDNFIRNKVTNNLKLVENKNIQSCKIGLLIPTSNKGKNWKKAEDTFLYNICIRSFLNTTNEFHNYVFYIGIDYDDKIWSKKENVEKLLEIKNKRKNIDFKFYNMNNVPKGHVTKMWNNLFKYAYNDNCHYFLQCGDDIEFRSIWIDSAIKILLLNNNIGLAGPVTNNSKILTQTFVSRKHMHIFGYYFPDNIKNWYCDDWINEIYKPAYYFPLFNQICLNKGEEPRYERNLNDLIIQKEIAEKHITISKNILSRYLTR
tara:strand:- start:3402 stop:4256 length:855 start_codon:yes stop_codon:yes gene_type:complete